MEQIKPIEKRGVSYPSTVINVLFSTVFLAAGCNNLHWKHLITFFIKYTGVLDSADVQNFTSENHLLSFLLFLLLTTSLILPVPKLSFTFLSRVSKHFAISLLAASGQNVVLFQLEQI